jgi:hypothetical protein
MSFTGHIPGNPIQFDHALVFENARARSLEIAP